MASTMYRVRNCSKETHWIWRTTHVKKMAHGSEMSISTSVAAAMSSERDCSQTIKKTSKTGKMANEPSCARSLSISSSVFVETKHKGSTVRQLGSSTLVASARPESLHHWLNWLSCRFVCPSSIRFSYPASGPPKSKFPRVYLDLR